MIIHVPHLRESSKAAIIIIINKLYTRISV